MPTSSSREAPFTNQDFHRRAQHRTVAVTYIKERSYQTTMLPLLHGTKKDNKSAISPAVQFASSHRPLRSNLKLPGGVCTTKISDVRIRQHISDSSSTTASSPSKHDGSSSPNRSPSSTNEAIDVDNIESGSLGKRRRLIDSQWDQKLALALQDESEEMPAVAEVVASTIKRAQARLSQCPVCKKALPKEPSAQLARRIRTFKSVRDDGSDDWKQRLIRTQYAICSLHMAEQQILPEGEKHGYPVHIDFDRLPDRARRNRKHLDGVIRGTITSPYKDAWETRFKEYGPLSKSTHMLMQVYPDTLPGYYGPRGSAVLFDTLREMFVRPSKTRSKLDKVDTIELIQMVLIPEASILLIREDYGDCDLERAREIRRDSVKFGQLVHHGEDCMEDTDDSEDNSSSDGSQCS